MDMQHILVVCVGNICRSPMAEYLLKQSCPERIIRSAGISAMVGHGADNKAVVCMDRCNIDMRCHIAQQLNEDMLKQADLILVMSTQQAQHIEQTWPFAKGKIFRLGHWQSVDVPDPYQHDQAFFDQTCLNIQSYVADWVDKI